MSVIWVSIILGGILIFYLSGILGVLGLLIAKIVERKKEKNSRKQKMATTKGKPKPN